MALMPTGLGWYADENWLRQSAGKMGSVSGVGSGTRIQEANFLIGSATHQGEIRTFSDDVCYAAWIYSPDSNGRGFCVVSETANGATVYRNGAVNGPSTNVNIAGTTYYIYYSYWDTSQTYIVNNVASLELNYSPTSTYNSRIVELIYGELLSFYKLNSGYAVPVIAKWIPWNTETPQISPVLISSEEPNTVLSLDGSSAITSALNTNAIGSKVFYMRYYLGGITEGDVTATGAQYVDFSTSHGPMTADVLFTLLARLASIGVGNPPSHVDPYSPEGTSTTGGGDGTHEIVQQNIQIPTLPSFSYANAGFFSIWIPTEDQIKTLATYMWNADPSDIDFWKRMIGDPIDLIIGMSVVPFDITPQGAASVTVGLVDTGVVMSYTDEQYFNIDCGTIEIPELWGAYIDYNPYTKIEIFLPYIGVKTLDADDIISRTLHLVYRVDIVSGSCVALIETVKDNQTMLLYHFEGNCSVTVPVSSFQMQGLISKMAATGVAVGAAVASGGAAIPLAGAITSAAALAATKNTSQKSGSVSSAAGMLDVQIPYLVLTRPNQALPENQNTYTGYPSFITEQLVDLSGYTEVEVIHLHNIPCTDAELSEIDNLLQKGVIF